MNGGGARTTPSTSVQWSDLPGDLLDLICSKVTPLLHRVRFAAVCRSWRAAAIAERQAAPPALPWLVFPGDDCMTKRVFCPEDGGVLQIPLLNETLIGKRFVGAHDGGWVAALGDNMQLAIVNLFSGVKVSPPAKDLSSVFSSQENPISKVIFSESPTSSGCIIAAITRPHDIALCRIGCRDSWWRTKRFYQHLIVDIIFYNGHLYGLTNSEDLIRFEIGANKDGSPVITDKPDLLHIQNSSVPIRFPTYIIELHKKLAMAVRIHPGGSREPFFKMFEIVDELTTMYTHKWKEVTSLGDYALFLGKIWSKVVYVPSARHGEVQRSCIYADNMTYLTSLDGHGERVYHMQDENSNNATQMIKSAGSYVGARSYPCVTWILPPNF